MFKLTNNTPNYLKQLINQHCIDIDNSETKPVHYIIIDRDLHQTFIKYFKLIPINQEFDVNYDVQEVDSIKFDHGSFEIEESIKRVIREHIEEDGKSECIPNYTHDEELENVRSTSKFENIDVSSIKFKYDSTEQIEISYKDFLEVLLPEYFQSEIDVIYNLSNKHSVDGIIPNLHLCGINNERILDRYLKDNMSLKIANYQSSIN